MLLLTLLLSSTIALIGAPPPPPTTAPEWLDKFLAMDWKEVENLSRELDERRSEGHAETSALPLASSSTNQARQARPFPSAFLNMLLKHIQGETTNNELAAIAEHLRPDQQLDGRGESIIRKQPPNEASQANAATDKVVHIHDPPRLANRVDQAVQRAQEPKQGLTPANIDRLRRLMQERARPGALPMQVSDLRLLASALPARLPVPSAYTRAFSGQLTEELREYLAGLRSTEVVEKEMIDLNIDGEGSLYPTHEFFRPSTQAQVVRLPSRLVLIKAFTRQKFRVKHRLPITLTMWTLEEQRDGQVLMLRGVYGVSQRLSHAIRDSTDFSYVVRNLRLSGTYAGVHMILKPRDWRTYRRLITSL